MTRFNNIGRRLAVTVAVLWLSACAHAPSRNDIPPGAGFTTRILANGTKLFVYSQRLMPGREGDSGLDDMPSGRGEGVDFDGDSGRQHRNPGPTALRGAQAMIAQNHYCREGFLVLEQFEQQGRYIIRGECRDAATAAERTEFSQK